MRCWQCGNNIDANATYCSECGAYVKRSEPISERGKALRQLYDQHGATKALSNTIWLSNSYGELCPNDNHFTKQLNLALESDICNMYLTQIESVGKPDSHFIRKIENVLLKDVGFSKKTAHDIINAFDEMIGWPSSKRTRTKTTTQKENHGSKISEYNHHMSRVEHQGKTNVKNSPLYIMYISMLLTLILIILTWTVIGSNERNLSRLCIAILNMIIALGFVVMLRKQKQKKLHISRFIFYLLLLANAALIVLAILEWAGIDAFEGYYYRYYFWQSYYDARVFRHVQTFVFMICSGIIWIVTTLLKSTPTDNK